MKTITEKINSITLEGFSGIDRLRSHTKPSAASDIVNFRICRDGSLEKREGYKLFCSLGKKIRAVFGGYIGGSYVCYALAGSDVFKIDAESGDANVIGSVSTSDTEADFFSYRGALYLIDGNGLYKITDGGTAQPFGYVPLVGKDWSDSVRGEPYEPRNLLNSKGRISYIASEKPSSVLYLDEAVSSVDAVYINGELISSERYSISGIAPMINVSGLSAGDKICVYFTYENTPYTAEAVMKNTHAAVFGGINNSRPFLFGGDNPSVIYSAAYVSDASLDASRLGYPASDALYFPNGYEFTVGDGCYPVKAVSRQYDRLLIFTEGNAWQADSSACGTEEFPIMKINSSVGVASTHGAALLGSSPYTVGKDGIYRWTTDTDELNDCNAYRISEPIDGLISENFLKNACIFADGRRRELLISSPAASDRVLVYSEEADAWSSFDGIGALDFFELNGSVGFIKENAVYVFDGNMYTDNGKEITAVFTSGICDFGTKASKHISEIGISLDDGTVSADIFTDGNTFSSASRTFSSQKHAYSSKRVSARRFDYLSAKLTAGGLSRPRLHSLYIKIR